MTNLKDAGEAKNPLKRILVLIAVALTGWHLFATFLWVAPRSELRDVVPGDALREYMLPMFSQSWSVFAPTPISGDYYFEVRAAVEQDGELEVTEWVRASDVEQSLATYRPFPPRAAKGGFNQARAFYVEWQDLQTDAKEIARLNYYKGEDWSDRLRTGLLSQTEATADVENYLQEERRSLAYATQVALAVWGEDVERIQFKASRQAIIPWSQRDDPEVERPEPRVSNPGWRGLVVEEGQSQEAFTDYFCAAPMEVCDGQD